MVSAPKFEIQKHIVKKNFMKILKGPGTVYRYFIHSSIKSGPGDVYRDLSVF
jgi:hypothetical protein